MVGAATENPRAHPTKLVLRRDRVRLARDFPKGIRSAEVAEVSSIAAEISQSALAGSPVGDLVWPQVFFEVAGGVQHRSGFEQGDLNAQIGQDLHNRASSGPGADDHHVVDGSTDGRLHHASLTLFKRLEYQLSRLIRAAGVRQTRRGTPRGVPRSLRRR